MVTFLALGLTGLAMAGPIEDQGALSSNGSATRPAPAAPTTGAAPDTIINGDDATVDDYPMTGGSIIDAEIAGFGYTLRSFVCSSTLIAPDVVLLAAHCIDELAISGGQFELNDVRYYWTREADLTDLDGTNPNAPLPEDAIEAWDWAQPSDWDITKLQMGLAENHDIALLFLKEAVPVPHAYLPTVEEAVQIVEGAEVDVVGWGQQIATNFGQQPPSGSYALKQKGTSFIAEVSPYELKIGEVEEDVRKCHGDSGGPSFMRVTTESTEPVRLIGVTSHAYDMTDCKETGGVDTRVDHYLEWIQEEMEDRCADGTRVWCEETGIPAIPPPPEEARACGCANTGEMQASGALMAALAAVLPALGLRRRQRAS